MGHHTAHGPWSDDEFPCDHELSRPISRRRPLLRDLQHAHAGASASLRGIDTELEALLRRRRACLAELDQLRTRLNRRWTHHHVRHRRRVDEPPMPPAPPSAVALEGTDLREVCVTLLRRHGPLSLREVHGLLHQYGYTVGGVRPVQRLADAMAYELRCGRTDRVSRGVYAAGDEGPRRVTRCPSPPPAPAPLVPWAPPVTGDAPPLVDPEVVEDPEHWSGAWDGDAMTELPAAPDEGAAGEGAAGEGAAGEGAAGDDAASAHEPAEPTASPDEPTPPPAPLGDDSSTNRSRGRQAGARSPDVDGASGRAGSPPRRGRSGQRRSRRRGSGWFRRWGG